MNSKHQFAANILHRNYCLLTYSLRHYLMINTNHSLTHSLMLYTCKRMFWTIYSHHVFAFSFFFFAPTQEVEREISFRTESGLYYSYYKQLIKSPSIAQGRFICIYMFLLIFCFKFYPLLEWFFSFVTFYTMNRE